MKTVVVIGSISRAGGGIFDAERHLQAALSSTAGIAVEVLTVGDEFADEDAVLWAPIRPRVFRRVGPAGLGYAPGLAKSLFDSESDLCYSVGLWQCPSFASLRWAKRTHRPLLIAPHGMLDPWALNNSKWRKRFAAWLFQDSGLKSAACLRALCESEAQSIRAYGLRNPICIIPNGIDLPENGQRDNGTGGQWSVVSGHSSEVSGQKAKGRKVLLYLGRIHPKKGLVNLLKAWKAVVSGQRSVVSGQWSAPWVLAIAGWDQDGHETELKQLATELGIPWADVRSPVVSGPVVGAQWSVVGGRWSIVFLGPQFGEAKAACYRNCDAFVLPSFSEGLPMVVLEAWAYGKPVLITPECNLPEGFAADAAIRIEPSVESIAQGLDTLFQSSISDLQSTGSRGRSLVADRFAWPRIAADMKAVYDWLLGGGPVPSCVVFK